MFININDWHEPQEGNHCALQFPISTTIYDEKPYRHRVWSFGMKTVEQQGFSARFQ